MKIDEAKFELHGTIQLLNDYSLMHLRKRNCVESINVYRLRNGEPKRFDELESLVRLKRVAVSFLEELENYKQNIL